MTEYVPFRQKELTQRRQAPPANPAKVANPAPEENNKISKISKISRQGRQDSSVIAIPTYQQCSRSDPCVVQDTYQYHIGQSVEGITAQEVSTPPATAEAVSAQSILPHHERLQVRWSTERGWIDLYDPMQRQWHTIPAKGNPRWLYELLPQRKT